MNIDSKMEELVKKLNYYTEKYDKGEPEISDKEWDDMFFELVQLEEKLGYTLSNSPTQKVIWSSVSELNKIKHDHLMLSLDKTKDLDVIKNFIGNSSYIAMCKMDGLTCSLKYKNGKLFSAETRGNGEIGEDILHNAKIISNIPLYISEKEELTIDGEIICDLESFYPFDIKNGGKYKNARNFAAGKIRSLDSLDCAKANLSFVAWDVVKGFESCKTLSQKLDRLEDFRFEVVPYSINNKNLEETIESLKTSAETYCYPIDGLVFKYNNIEEYISKGRTEHHFKGGIAYKFYDDEYETKLLDITYDVSRNGILTPVAIFEPIDIDGTLVSRASLHNLSVMKNILNSESGWVNQKINVYKSNMIIPQISSAEKDDEYTKQYIDIIKVCPYCGKETIIKESNDGVKILYCSNEQCTCRFINRLDHFCGKKGLDIKGLSKHTLEKLESKGWLKNISDLFLLHNKKSSWVNLSGFGETSVNKILDAIEKSKNTTLEKILCGIGIPLIGSSSAKEISKRVKGSYDNFRQLVNDSKFDFSEWNGFGFEMNSALKEFNYDELDYIVKNYLTIETINEEESTNNKINGLTFVITGKLSKSREEIKADIERAGGKVTGSVSSKTNYLVCNTPENTTKYKKALELNIPIINEKKLFEIL